MLAASAQAAGGPTAVTGVATPGITTATIAGVVNPNGFATVYGFQYGTTSSYGKATAIKSAGNGTTNVNVAQALTGLRSNTTYHYRLVASNQGPGPNYYGAINAGADRTFRTKPVPPRVKIGIASSRATVTRGVFGIRISCRGPSRYVCRGVVAVTIRVRQRVHRRLRTRVVTIGKARFAVRSPTTRTVRIRLSRTGRRALDRGRHHALRVRVTAFDGAASPSRVSRVVLLKRR